MPTDVAVGQSMVEAFRVERRGIDLRAGLAGAVATSGPLALGVAAGEPAIAATACFGGLNASLQFLAPLRERLAGRSGAARVPRISTSRSPSRAAAASVAAALP